MHAILSTSQLALTHFVNVAVSLNTILSTSQLALTQSSFTLLQIVTSCCRLLQAVTSCYRLLQAVTGCYKLLQAVTGCYKLLQVVTSCYRLLQAVTSCYRLLLLHIATYYYQPHQPEAGHTNWGVGQFASQDDCQGNGLPYAILPADNFNFQCTFAKHDKQKTG